MKDATAGILIDIRHVRISYYDTLSFLSQPPLQAEFFLSGVQAGVVNVIHVSLSV